MIHICLENPSARPRYRLSASERRRKEEEEEKGVFKASDE